MTLSASHHDAIVLVHRHPRDWSVKGCHKPLFICAEMFLELRDIESRRWKMWALRGNLVDAGLPVATLSEFLLPEDVAWLESQSARVAHEWYLGDDGDITIYRGVSLGRCVEYEVKARAVRLLKLSRCIQRLLQRHPTRRSTQTSLITRSSNEYSDNFALRFIDLGPPKKALEFTQRMRALRSLFLRWSWQRAANGACWP